MRQPRLPDAGKAGRTLLEQQPTLTTTCTTLKGPHIMASLILHPDAAEAIHGRVVRMLAFVDLAGRVAHSDDPELPGAGEATDSNDKISALLHALQNELEELHAEVSHV